VHLDRLAESAQHFQTREPLPEFFGQGVVLKSFIQLVGAARNV
jgi:hypothetical protein